MQEISHHHCMITPGQTHGCETNEIWS